MERAQAQSAGWVGEQLALARHKIDGAITAMRALDRLTSSEVRTFNVQFDDLAAEMGRLQGAAERLMQRTAQAPTQIPGRQL